MLHILQSKEKWQTKVNKLDIVTVRVMWVNNIGVRYCKRRNTMTSIVAAYTQTHLHQPTNIQKHQIKTRCNLFLCQNGSKFKLTPAR